MLSLRNRTISKGVRIIRSAPIGMLRADWQVCEICFACQEIQSTHSSHYFRPEDLYDLVWTSPVSEVAARLGASDVALAKLCRRAAIPRPGRGYWQRTESGQPIGQTPLPTAA